VFEEREKVFGNKRDNLTGDSITRSFMICTAHHGLLGGSNEEE
jgi:hypothetical protein